MIFPLFIGKKVIVFAKFLSPIDYVDYSVFCMGKRTSVVVCGWQLQENNFFF
jgi:hypothetical protein